MTTIGLRANNRIRPHKNNDYGGSTMNKFRTGCVVFACLALFSLHASAVTINVQTNADANISNFSGGDPIGSVNLLAPFTGSGYSVYSYIGFDAGAFLSLGAQASTVSLDLFGFGSRTSLELNIYGLNDSVSTNWAENTIDWSNAPGKLANSIDPAATTLLFSGTVSYTANNVISFSNSSFVDFVNSDTDGLITFILTQPDVTSTNHAFSSKESSGNPAIGSPGDYAPTLSIATIPLPGTLWLLASGLLGLFSLRKDPLHRSR
jgi:PEP-CTERM motif